MSNILFNGNFYPFAFWSSETGNIGNIFAYDTETTLINKECDYEIPEYIISTAYNGKGVYFIPKFSLKCFFEMHKHAKIFMANATFDLNVSSKVTEISPTAFLDNNSIIDVLILARLIELATVGKTSQAMSLQIATQNYLNINIEKDEYTRCTFGQYLKEDGTIDYSNMTREHLKYAAVDAIVTYDVGIKLLKLTKEVCTKFDVEFKLLLSHQLQIKAAYSLSAITQNGMLVDLDKAKEVKSKLKAAELDSLQILEKNEWHPGKGSSKQLQKLLAQICTRLHVKLPKTEKGAISTKLDDLEEAFEFHNDEFINSYITYKQMHKLQDFIDENKNTVHPHFNVLVNTGRTSSYKPNLQNIPRNVDIRSMFIAPPNQVLLSVDYNQIELKTLAQILYSKFGNSKMLELINSGVDLHRYFASVITGKPISDITSEERQKAKACNFGFPGGLGIYTFRTVASKTYGVNLSEEEARLLKDKWLETFPEVKEYLEDNHIDYLVNSTFLDSYSSQEIRIKNKKNIAYLFKDIINGNYHNIFGDMYTDNERSWAFNIVNKYDFPNKNELVSDISERKGSRKLWSNFSAIFNHIIFSSGRIQNHPTYCAHKNNWFQGLAADGAKEALYQLVKSGYKVCNFIHDEFLIYLPLDSDLKAAEDNIKSILINCMKKYCLDVDISTESNWMFSWNKKGTHTLNREGQLIPIAEIENECIEIKLDKAS